MSWKIENTEILEYLNNGNNKVPQKLRFLAGFSMFVGQPIANLVSPGLILSLFSVFLNKESLILSLVFYLLCLGVFSLLILYIYELLKKLKEKKIDPHAILNCIGLAFSYLGLGMVYY